MTTDSPYWIIDSLATKRRGGRRAFYAETAGIGPRFTPSRDAARLFGSRADARGMVAAFPAAVSARVERACTCDDKPGLCEGCQVEYEYLLRMNGHQKGG